MQKLAEISIRRPVFATMIVMALVVVGAAGYFKLGVDRTPPVDLPSVYVSTRLPGASPAEMESLVAQPIEEVVNTVEGITELRSISGQGSSFVIIQFDLRRNVNVAAEDVRTRVATVIPDLPREADPPVITKFDSDRSPVMTVALSGERSQRELTELADKIVKRQLERTLGVGEVEIRGGLERAISIWVDADRLSAYQIPITAVREAIVRQNANVPGGNVISPLREQSLRTMGRLTAAREFNDLVITTRNGSPIRVRDVGWAEDGTKEQRSLARLNGRPSVTLEIKRQSDANAVAVTEAIKAKLPQVAAQLPPDVKFEVIEDQSRYIYEALHEINTHLIVGSILASLVVFGFMRSWRATLIAAVAIPTSVISTFGMMWALNFTLNSVTMLALVLMVGIVIDDAIVVLENIFRWVEEKKMNSFEAARAATKEIGTAVLATTLSLVVIFVPVSFMSSIAGRFLFQFGLTAAVAVLVSLLVSFTLTPMMSARLFNLSALSSGHQRPKSRSGFYSRIDRTYSAILGLALRHRLWVVSGAALVMLASLPLYRMVRQEFTPANTDEGEFEIGITAPEGTSLTAMDDVLRGVEQELRSLPPVRAMLASIGAGRMGGVNYARVYIRIPPHHAEEPGKLRLKKAPIESKLAPLKRGRGRHCRPGLIRFRVGQPQRAGMLRPLSLHRIERLRCSRCCCCRSRGRSRRGCRLPRRRRRRHLCRHGQENNRSHQRQHCRYPAYQRRRLRAENRDLIPGKNIRRVKQQNDQQSQPRRKKRADQRLPRRPLQPRRLPDVHLRLFDLLLLGDLDKRLHEWLHFLVLRELLQVLL